MITEVVKLSDYKRPSYFTPKIDLHVNIFEKETIVTSTMKVILNKDEADFVPMILQGEELDLIDISIDGETVEHYRKTEKDLTFHPTKKEFTLSTKVRIHPDKNTFLEGLYQSGDIYCTQNEPEGMRRITYCVDRPDNMSLYTTTIEADKKRFPVLLSNGNRTDAGDCKNDSNRHYAVWNDPFKKPSYLYALVAGDLAVIKDSYKTKSGKDVTIEFYCDHGKEGRLPFAVESLKESMKWDEETFGLEYDLDIYMIVAVESFNMGAMENKGLNIFNSFYLYSDPKTETDEDLLGVRGVVGHEYFHNWTGNRVTCRDWFQLTLKEGLTVFRDQEFSSDLYHRAIKRINDVQLVRRAQFTEDSGPQAHPIRPQSFIKVDNFYTMTVYEKGSEVIRMVHTLLGEKDFKAGITRYFELYDGQAVTTDDFIFAMEDASKKDLKQFKESWYNKKGTPTLEVEFIGEAISDKKTLKIKQKDPFKESQANYPFYHLPLNVAFFSKETGKLIKEKTLELKKEEESFVFEGLKGEVIPSYNRNFSAPVKIKSSQTHRDLAFLAKNEKDLFSRWDSFQKITTQLLLNLIEKEKKVTIPSWYEDIFLELLTDEKIDGSFKQLTLTLPAMSEILEQQNIYNIDKTISIMKEFKHHLATRFESEMIGLFEKEQASKKSYEFNFEDISRRKMKELLLSYLSVLKENKKIADFIRNDYFSSDNMTDKITAFNVSSSYSPSLQQEISSDFFNKWKDEAVVMLKWFSAEAKREDLDSVEKYQKVIFENSSFSMLVPNKVREAFRGFVRNLELFHAKDGSGYEYLVDQTIKLNKINPSVASRMGQSFNCLKRLDEKRKPLMEKAIKRMMDEKDLSENLYEVLKNIVS